jgi:hypothetical protein
MVGTMEEARIPGYFKNKGILITGSTGFLGKSKHAACLSCLAERTNGNFGSCCMHCAHLHLIFLCLVLPRCSTGGEDTEGPAGRQEDLPPGASAGRGIGQETGGD